MFSLLAPPFPFARSSCTSCEPSGRRVEGSCFEEVSSLCLSASAQSVIVHAAQRIPECSLPLMEVDVLVNGSVSETDILDNGSPNVIWADLVREVQASVPVQFKQ
jgi:hypothetical protein